MGLAFIIVGILFIVGGILFLRHWYPKSSTDTWDRVSNLQDRYNPEITPIQAKRQAEKSVTRTELANQIGKEVRAVADMELQQVTVKRAVFENEQAISRLNRGEELTVTQQKHDVDNLNLQRNLIAFAQEEGMDVATYLEVLKTRALNKVEMERIKAEAETELKAGFVYQLQAYQRLNLLRDTLDTLYDRAYQIESGNEPEPVKQRKLLQVEADIKLHEEDIGARRKKLLQAFDGDGQNEDTEESQD